MTANVLDFTGRESAWHKLGTVWQPGQQPDVVEGFVIANADYEVEVVEIPEISAFGQTISSGKCQIVRGPIRNHDDNIAVLGNCGKNYSPVQNLEIAEAVQVISARENWPLETVGVLGKGERVFCTLAADEYDIAGDPVRRYFLISEGKNGGTSLRIAVVHVRVVCENTLMLALQDAFIDVAVQHTGNVHDKLEFNLDIVAQMHAAQASVTEAMRVLAQAKLKPEQVTQVLEAAYPSERVTRGVLTAKQILDSTVTLDDARKSSLGEALKRHDDALRHVAVYRDAARERYEIFNDEIPQHAGTAWAVYNSVVEVEQYRKGKSDKARAESMLFGGRGSTSARAFEEAYKIATN
jgi:phage/plasmid-like protein (TIGR03299 family)